MQFTHMHYAPGETIVALATPPGESGVAIIRISGNDAIAISQKMISKNLSTLVSHTAQLVKIIGKEGETLDRALLLPLLGNRSYTGEDTLEIQCHGGTLIPQKIIARAVECGARPAFPGEFSYKAFMNGKLTLSQAEAVQQLIASKSESALVAANAQLEGRLHTKVSGFQRKLFDIAAILEAWVDFPEEGLEFASFEEIQGMLKGVAGEIEQLIATYREGRRLSTGYGLCIIGLPNVGKSSLLNALLGNDRAIVTPIAGTTRDLIEEELFFGGYHFTCIDTAGIRETDELIEREGIRRSKKAAELADIILFVMDRSQGIEGSEALLAAMPEEKCIIVWNKSDLDLRKDISLSYSHTVHLSAKNDEGIEQLKKAILEKVASAHVYKDEVTLTTERHYNALHEALKALSAVIDGLDTGISAEFVASDMRACLKNLGTIIGSDITEELLSSIFAKFCVGK